MIAPPRPLPAELESRRVAEEVVGLLLRQGRVTAAMVERASRAQGDSGERLDVLLAKLGLVAEPDLARAYAECCGLRLLGPEDFPEDPLFDDLLSRKFLKDARLLPVADGPGGVVLALADPLDIEACRAVELCLDRTVLRAVAFPADIESAHDRLYGREMGVDLLFGDESETGGDDIDRLKDLASEAPVIRYVNGLIARAVELGASDIHIEPMSHRLRVRLRVDGRLREVESPPGGMGSALVSRIKIMAKLNIAERRLAQDGRIRTAVRGREVDLRISTTPALHGESVVMRILDRSALTLDFAALGFDEALRSRYLQVLQKPHGILLVSGPTGSGKTTTLYASLAHLNNPDCKILTVEDPVEYVLEGINQVQVKPKIGLTFACALRSFLRQDPDILMVGEIRDAETAQIAVQAALTGHLVLSTIHTNDAASAVTRLLDMGLDGFLLTSTINAVVAQRLVRTLCPHCREAHAASEDEREALGLAEGALIFRAGGCPQCGGRGYGGRTTILEIMELSDALRHAVLNHPEARSLQKLAVSEGMQTMLQHGVQKILAGVTTAEEVLRATRDD